MFIAFAINAQTPFMILSSQKKPANAAERVASLANPYVGAKLAYNISGDVSESFLLSAKAMYVAASGAGWAVPIVANVGLGQPDTVNENGVSIGMFPYYSVTNETQLQLLLHGGVNYKIADNQNALNQFRFLAGVEVALYPKDRSMPITFSIAPEYIKNVGVIDNSWWQLSMTGVVPIANGLGLLLEGAVPFNNSDFDTGLKIGVIVNSEID